LPDSNRTPPLPGDQLLPADGLPSATAADPGALRPGWRPPSPDKLPPPTYNPVVFALGINFLALGMISSYYLAIVGGVLFVIGLGKWIIELEHEH
jgi:hypothetical protein